MEGACVQLFDRNEIELQRPAATAAAAAARIMHYLQLLFPLQRKSEIYRLRSIASMQVHFDDNPSVLSQRRRRIRLNPRELETN